MYSEDFWVMINIVVPVACLLKTGLMDSMCVYANLYMVFEWDCNFWKLPYWNCYKQFSMELLKIAEFVGEVLIFAINHDFQSTNPVIKIMLCFLTFVFHFLWCCLLCISTFLSMFFSTVNYKWNDEFMHAEDQCVIYFLLFSYVIFLIFCKLFLLYFLYMGSMLIYISLYILWKPAIKTIIFIIIIVIVVIIVIINSGQALQWDQLSVTKVYHGW